MQAFITSVVLAGRDRAVAGLVANRTDDRIEACLPYLQSPALTPDQRRMVRSLDIDLDDLRAEVATAIGLEAPKLVQLRRFSVGSVIRVALPLLALFMLVSALAGFDLDRVRRVVAGCELVARGDSAPSWPSSRASRRRWRPSVPRRSRCRSARCTRCSWRSPTSTSRSRPPRHASP